MNGATLRGLDGANPLGFLAALGALDALGAGARLSWRNQGRWHPVFHDVGSIEDIVEALARDLRSWDDDPTLLLRYRKPNGKEVGDLKPPPADFLAYLTGLKGERALAFAAAFATETATDNNGNTKPTALHFTAGQQLFLDMVLQLQRGVTAEDLTRAIQGPWTRASKLPSLSWDATVYRAWALRASDPSKEKRGSEPGAEWLAFRGLCFFPTVPIGRRVFTTCVSGRWKTGRMRWPLWDVPAAAPTVRALLTTLNLTTLNSEQRSVLNIPVVFEAAIQRSDQGGYGSFSPARVL
ncbi:MAG: hypothetical protein H6739_00950 [Alphaproteobacteria bacterium]|nr:hypothetical protein [Alphaproteobacteria bacterium]